MANTIIATFVELNRAVRRVDDDEPLYEDIAGRLPSISTVTTQENVAYHHVQRGNTETATTLGVHYAA